MAKKNYFLKLAAIIIAFFAVSNFVGCKKGGNDPHPKDPPTQSGDYTLSDNTTEIDDQWDSRIAEPVTDSVIVLSSTQGLTLPNVGEILIKPGITEEFPNGFLGKVVEVKQEGGGVKIVTESVPLDEAFEELDINDNEVDITDNVVAVTDSLGNPISFSQTNATKASTEGKVTVFPINVVFGAEGSSVKSSLKGSIELGSKLDFNMNIRKHQLEYFKIAITPSFTASAELTTEFSGDNEEKIHIATVYFAPVAAGPIVLNPELNIYAGIDVSGKVSFTAQFSYSTSTTIGCYYDGSWQKIENDRSPKNESPFAPSSITMDGRVGVGPTLELKLKVYNNDNLSASIKCKSLLAFTTKFEWNIVKALSGGLYESFSGLTSKISLLLEGEASVNIRLFKLLSYEPKFTISNEIVIAEKPLLPNITDLRAANGNADNEKLVSYVLTDDVIFPGKYGMKLYDGNTELSTTYYNSAPVFITLLPTTVPGFTYDGLVKGKTYTARPVFNLFGLEIVEKQFVNFKVDDDPPPPDNPPASGEEGVLINGVRWATRNVDAPGSFAAAPESYGMFYQWNRKKAWPATGTVTGWDDTYPSGDVWAAANDPCPAGWRVPTKDEQATLLDTDKVTNVWTTLNGVNGWKSTDKVSDASIFLAFAGSRYHLYGSLQLVGIDGNYWSSSPDTSHLAWSLYLFYSDFNHSGSTRTEGYSVRCVRQ